MTEAESLHLEAATTALVVIDLQKGIVGRPCEPHATADVVGNSARLANTMRESGGFVVLVTVSFAPGRRDALHPKSDDPGWGSAPLPADWAEIVSEMGPHPGDHLVTKASRAPRATATSAATSRSSSRTRWLPEALPSTSTP
jgi:nicotinamidase-related amidase